MKTKIEKIVKSFAVKFSLMVSLVIWALLLCQPSKLHSQPYTNNIFANTNQLVPYYSISNYYSLNSAQVLFNDTNNNATNYYTNTAAQSATNYSTGVTVPWMGAAKSLNVYFLASLKMNNTNILGGTNIGVAFFIDASTGFGDWYPLVTLTAFSGLGGMVTLTTNSTTVATTIATNLNVGGAQLFRLNRVVFTNNNSASIAATNINFSYSCKLNL